MSVWDPRHNINHYLVLGFLHGVTPRDYYHYLRSRA